MPDKTRLHRDTLKMGEPSDVHVDATLSNISIKYRNDDFIGLQIMPIVPVARRSDKYYVYDRDQAFRIDDDSLTPKGLPNEIDMKQTTENFSVDSHGLADWVPQEEIDNADAPLAPLSDATENLRDKLLLAHEKRIADQLQTAANYPSGYKVQLSGTDQWSDYTNSDPLGDLLTAVEGTFTRANVVSMGLDTWKILRAHPKVLDAVKASTRQQSTPGGFATPEEMITLLEIQTLLIGRARYNSAKRGQSGSYSRIWGKHCMAFYVEPSPGIRKASWGYTFSENRGTTFTMFDVKRGEKGATYVKDAWNEDSKIVGNILGYFIEDAVA